ncbi:hypothetical protein ABBQ32_009441 [Trebouxia sp. C0010 RCD-2024]
MSRVPGSLDRTLPYWMSGTGRIRLSSDKTCLQCSGRSEAHGKQAVVPLKLMARHPRGTSVKEHHGLPSLKGIQFAEQLQVNGMELNTKDKKTCACFTPAEATAEKEICCSSDAHTVAEVQALYQLPEGSWWVQYLPFFSATQIQNALAESKSASLLPSGTDHQQEFFRGLLHGHVEADSVQGTKTVRRSKVTGHMKKNKAGYFWRHSFDEQGCQVVTDRPVTDFLEKQ